MVVRGKGQERVEVRKGKPELDNLKVQFRNCVEVLCREAKHSGMVYSSLLKLNNILT